MDNREWERFGEEIRRNVQDAVDSRDFSSRAFPIPFLLSLFTTAIGPKKFLAVAS